MRKSLAKLGFFSDLGELSFRKAEYFCYIDGQINEMEVKKLKANKPKKGGKRHGR